MFISKLTIRPLLLTAIAFMIGAAGGVATAGQGGHNASKADSQRLAQSSQEQSIEFSEEQLETFVEARAEVIEISRKWQDRLNNVESQDELTEAQNAAQEEMVEAVQDQGLSVEDYNLIADAAQRDPELMDQLNDMMSQ